MSLELGSLRISLQLALRRFQEYNFLPVKGIPLSRQLRACRFKVPPLSMGGAGVRGDFKRQISFVY